MPELETESTIEFELWIDTTEFLMRRISMDIDMAPNSLDIDDFIEGTVTLSMDMLLTDFGKEVSITAPEIGIVATPSPNAGNAGYRPIATPVPAASAPSAKGSFSGSLTVVHFDTDEPNGLPRHCTAGCSETIYLSGVTDTLFSTIARSDGTVAAEPMLALDFTFDPSLEYGDFSLRQGVQFHNGWGEMTSEDVAFSFNDANSVTKPKSIHGQAGDFAPLILSMKPLDKYTVRLNYRNYDSRGILQVNEAASRRAMLETGEAHIAEVPLSYFPELIQSGFSIQKGAGFNSIHNISFAGNYWDKYSVLTGAPLSRDRDISMPWVGDPFENGEYSETTASMISSMKVQNALARSIDRQTLLDEIFGGFGFVNHQPYLSSNNLNFREEWSWGTDYDLARSFLVNAGYQDGFEMDFHLRDQAVYHAAGEAIAATWLAKLNVRANLIKARYATYRPGQSPAPQAPRLSPLAATRTSLISLTTGHTGL